MGEGRPGRSLPFGVPLRGLEFLFAELITAGIGVVAVWFGAQVVRRVLDPSSDGRERSRARREAVLHRLIASGVDPLSLDNMSPSEEALLGDLVFPEDIKVTFSHVGGLEKIKESLREIVVYPLVYPKLYGLDDGACETGDSSKSTRVRKPTTLLAPPKGVLLYGPPGTGKTYTASALAKESGANFLALSPSSMLSKWLGETEQTARAVFSLARRIAPTIIFIDEVDGLFRERSSSEHEAHKNMKAEFMQIWDGLLRDDTRPVVVVGATNRPYDVDPAILRRMPRAFEIGLPSEGDRALIVEKLLAGVEIAPDFSYADVAAATESYSGSDLKELLRAAMMQPVREAIRVVNKQVRAGRARGSRASRASTSDSQESSVSSSIAALKMQTPNLRPLRVSDVLHARDSVTRTEVLSRKYLHDSMVHR